MFIQSPYEIELLGRTVSIEHQTLAIKSIRTRFVSSKNKHSILQYNVYLRIDKDFDDITLNNIL